jgi:hypothetical protein
MKDKALSIILDREELSHFFDILTYTKNTPHSKCWRSAMRDAYNTRDINKFCMVFYDNDINLLYDALMVYNSGDEVYNEILHGVREYIRSNSEVYTGYGYTTSSISSTSSIYWNGTSSSTSYIPW